MVTKTKTKKRQYKLTSKQSSQAKRLYAKGHTTLDSLQNAMKKKGVGAARLSISNWMRAKGKIKKPSEYAKRVRALRVAKPELSYKGAMREISLTPTYARKRTGREVGYRGGAKRKDRMREIREQLEGEKPYLTSDETKDQAFNQMQDEGATFGDTPH